MAALDEEAEFEVSMWVGAGEVDLASGEDEDDTSVWKPELSIAKRHQGIPGGSTTEGANGWIPVIFRRPCLMTSLHSSTALFVSGAPPLSSPRSKLLCYHSQTMDNHQ